MRLRHPSRRLMQTFGALKMEDSTKLFALADADDAGGLVQALGKAESHRIRNANGETILLYSLFRGRTKCVEALTARSGLSLHEAAAVGAVRRVDECVRAAPWTIQALSADGWPALHLAG